MNAVARVKATFAKAKESWRSLLEEYGRIAIFTYFGIFFSVWGGFYLAIKMGLDVESAAGGAGTLGAAYVATKVTQPIRIAVTVVVTPFLARLIRRPNSESEANVGLEQESAAPEQADDVVCEPEADVSVETESSGHAESGLE